jgi:2-dehydropantoate 2-reductase
MAGKRNIVIVGAGALGGHVGAYLIRSGQRVTLVDPWPEHVEKMRTDGLTLRGQTAPENFTVKADAWHITELQQANKGEPYDIAFVAMKSYDTLWATEMIKPYLAPDAYVVSLQNSINEERIASVVGWGKTVGCIAATIAVELVSPGLIQRNVALGGEKRLIFRVGEPHGRITPRTTEIAGMLSVCDSAEPTENLWGERWSKLVVNAMRNPVSAATGRGGNGNDRDPVTRKLAIRIAAEAIDVGLAHGYSLEEVYKMDPMKVKAAGAGDRGAMEYCEGVLLENTKFRNDDQRPSMGQDILKGRRTEIDYINGLVVEKAEELGIATPANRGIIEAVKKVERGAAKPSPELVAGI